MWSNPELQENFDIIIEDGLHAFHANVCFFENSIHKLKSGGYYIIEDLRRPELHMFVNKLKEWKIQYPNCVFKMMQIPSTKNHFDNTLLVVHKK